MNLYDGNGVMIPIGGGGDSKRPWLNIAHAGTAPDAYGNSLYAFNRSHEYGFDGIELDVRLTADNVVVNCHNSEVTGTDSHGVTKTLTIATSTYAEIADLTRFTIDGVPYNTLRFDDIIRMAFFWNWFIQLDVKTAGNAAACMEECAHIIRNNGMIGRVMYMGSMNETLLGKVLDDDPLAIFNVGNSTDISQSVYADIPPERVWIAIKQSEFPASMDDVQRDHPLYIWDVGASGANACMELRPQLIQWGGGSDGPSLSDTFLANVDWSFT